MIKEFNKF